MDQVRNFEITVTVVEDSSEAVRELREAVAGLFKVSTGVFLESVTNETVVSMALIVPRYSYRFRVDILEEE